MRTIKIFAFPSHGTIDRVSGVDFVRVIQPMQALNGFEYEGVKFKVTIFDPKEKDPTDWLGVAKTHDIIYFNYLNSAWGFAAMGAMARGQGVKLVMDVDDSLWNLKSDNSAQTVYKKGGEALHNFEAICNEVDVMTVTNSYLKHIVMNHTKKKDHQIKVFPNYINLELYNHKSPFKNDGQIELLHHGSTTHYGDLLDEEFAKGVDQIMREYPNVTIRFVGSFFSKYKMRWGARCFTDYGHADIYHWIQDANKFGKFMDQADVLVVPLSDDIYNRAKSSIKFLETSSAGIPGVYQRVRQYEEVVKDGENGFLAKSHQEWYKSIKALIDDPEKRKKMGEAAFKTVEEEWQMKQHRADYAAFFKQLMI